MLSGDRPRGFDGQRVAEALGNVDGWLVPGGGGIGMRLGTVQARSSTIVPGGGYITDAEYNQGRKRCELFDADLYGALRSARAAKAMARKALESVRVSDRLSEHIDGLDQRLGMLMWVVGLNIGCTIGLYALLFRALP